MVVLIAEKENWVILNFKTGHSVLNEIQNLAISKPKNMIISTCQRHFYRFIVDISFWFLI